MGQERFAVFVHTDLVDSTGQWDRQAAAMALAVERLDKLASGAVAANGGDIFKHTGDGFWAVFNSPVAALLAMAELVRSLVGDEQLALRVGVHLGAAEWRDGDYFGPTLNRCSRVAALAHGGQVLVTKAVAAAAGADLVDGLELGCLGTVRLRGLSEPETVYQLTGPGLETDFPPLPGSADTLPRPLTRLIGRSDELVDVEGAIDGGQRIATLCGVGGSGKTRLAIELGHRLIPVFPDGVAFVDLSEVGQPRAVRDALAAALGLAKVDDVAAGAAAADRVVEALVPRSMLLVLDNCEHVIDPVVGLVSDVVAVAPDVRILVTSREPLGLAGERVWRVGPMADDDAVELLEERARDANAGFRLDAAERLLAVEVCRRLDGMPLAIELAAARLRAMSLADVSARLRARFRLLAGGGRTHDRHATLRATLDWSYDLLTDEERTLLARLSVFSGGFKVEAVEEVCGFEPLEPARVLDVLSSLLDKSLVVITQHHGATRYSMLETVRAYSGEKLAARGESERTNRRHTGWIVRLAWDWFASLSGPGRDVRSCGELPGELDNLRAAQDRAVTDHDASTALGLGASLAALTVNEIPAEALSRCERALALDGGDPFLRSQCHLTAALATAAHMRAPWEHLARARALVEGHGLDDGAVANTETVLASLMDPPDDVPFARRLEDYAVRIPDAIPAGIRASAIASLAARRAVADGNLEEGLRLANHAITSLGHLDGGTVFNAAWATAYLTYIEIALGQPDALSEANERTIEQGRDTGLRVLLEALRIMRDLIAGQTPDLEVDAVVADAQRVGWTEAAVRRPIAAMVASRRPDLDVRVALPLLASAKAWDFGLLATAREALRRRGRAELDDKEFDQLVAEGASLTDNEANALASQIIRQATPSAGIP